MKQTEVDTNHEGKGEAKLELYKLAIKDAQHIFNTYKNTHPNEAWDTIRRIIFNPKLK